MVARGTYGTEGIVHPAVHDLLYGLYAGPGGQPGGAKAIGV
jgi:hypothetical protein